MEEAEDERIRRIRSSLDKYYIRVSDFYIGYVSSENNYDTRGTARKHSNFRRKKWTLPKDTVDPVYRNSEDAWKHFSSCSGPNFQSFWNRALDKQYLVRGRATRHKRKKQHVGRLFSECVFLQDLAKSFTDKEWISGGGADADEETQAAARAEARAAAATRFRDIRESQLEARKAYTSYRVDIPGVASTTDKTDLFLRDAHEELLFPHYLSIQWSTLKKHLGAKTVAQEGNVGLKTLKETITSACYNKAGGVEWEVNEPIAEGGENRKNFQSNLRTLERTRRARRNQPEDTLSEMYGFGILQNMERVTVASMLGSMVHQKLLQRYCFDVPVAAAVARELLYEKSRYRQPWKPIGMDDNLVQVDVAEIPSEAQHAETENDIWRVSPVIKKDGGIKTQRRYRGKTCVFGDRACIIVGKKKRKGWPVRFFQQERLESETEFVEDPQPVENIVFVGLTLTKRFGNKEFKGEILQQRFDIGESQWMWRIYYEDGDGEDLSIKQMIPLLARLDDSEGDDEDDGDDGDGDGDGDGDAGPWSDDDAELVRRTYVDQSDWVGYRKYLRPLWQNNEENNEEKLRLYRSTGAYQILFPEIQVNPVAGDDGQRVVVPRTIENYLNGLGSYTIGDGRPLVDTLADRIHAALGVRRYEMLFLEPLIYDPYRMFWVDDALRFFWTRADFVAQKDGKFVLGDFKTRPGEYTQFKVLQDGAEAKQVIINAFLFSITHRVKIETLSIVTVNRYEDVFVVEHDFDLNNAYIRSVLEAFFHLDALYIDAKWMMMHGTSIADSKHNALQQDASSLGANWAAGADDDVDAWEMAELWRSEKETGSWYAKQKGWTRVRAYDSPGPKSDNCVWDFTNKMGEEVRVNIGSFAAIANPYRAGTRSRVYPRAEMEEDRLVRKQLNDRLHAAAERMRPYFLMDQHSPEDLEDACTAFVGMPPIGPNHPFLNVSNPREPHLIVARAMNRHINIQARFAIGAAADRDFKYFPHLSQRPFWNNYLLDFAQNVLLKESVRYLLNHLIEGGYFTNHLDKQRILEEL